MILTVSTVKDRLPNVQRFVRGNLAGGADHMLVFLDGEQPEVESWLRAQEHVTALVSDAAWWGSQRPPEKLNRRQLAGANLAKDVAADVGWVTWLVHVDADEVVRLDRDELERLPRSKRAVRLAPLEVVSELAPSGEPTWFKRLLEDDELELLCALGLLDEPTNSLYFRSHIAGKMGVRPEADLRLGLHKVMDATGERVPVGKQPGMYHLHYESYSGEDFVRKWTNIIGSGPRINFGPHRMRLATALGSLLSREMDEQARSRLLTRLYERHMADDVVTLRELGLLEQVDVYAPRWRPRSTAQQSRQLAEALQNLHGQARRWAVRVGDDDGAAGGTADPTGGRKRSRERKDGGGVGRRLLGR